MMWRCAVQEARVRFQGQWKGNYERRGEMPLDTPGF